jgi:hypothetical protein
MGMHPRNRAVLSSIFEQQTVMMCDVMCCDVSNAPPSLSLALHTAYQLYNSRESIDATILGTLFGLYHLHVDAYF